MESSSKTSLWSPWNYLNETNLSSVSSSQEKSVSVLNSSASCVDWIIKNRGGLAKIAGMVMVPSQFDGTGFECNKTVEGLVQKNPNIKRLNFIGKDVRGIIIYPENYDHENKQKCVVYNNPNACTISRFFDSYGLYKGAPPYKILQLRKCPIIMFDYRGTGLSPCYETSMQFRPTYHSIVEDGQVALEYAMKEFDNVEMWGTSLGGGVATIATERYLEKNPRDVQRLSLTNHDSFTTTGKVVLPGFWSKIVGVVFGDLNAEAPMKKLIDRKVKIIVLCHQGDYIIPLRARMAELPELKCKSNVTIIRSHEVAHGPLTFDMVKDLNNEKEKDGDLDWVDMNALIRDVNS